MVYAEEVARKFGVSSRTIRRMQGDFAALAKIKKESPSGRVYFDRADYKKWIAAKKARNLRRSMIRRTKKVIVKCSLGK